MAKLRQCHHGNAAGINSPPQRLATSLPSVEWMCVDAWSECVLVLGIDVPLFSTSPHLSLSLSLAILSFSFLLCLFISFLSLSLPRFISPSLSHSLFTLFFLFLILLPYPTLSLSLWQRLTLKKSAITNN